MPRVTVLMSVYNGEKYLREAIVSILDQTYTDFEFIIIDDHSTDLSPEILSSYFDPRIKIVRNETNIGLTKSLNKGLSLASGEFIARMDVDDISEPCRLTEQVNFLDGNPEIAVVGSWIKYIDGSGNIIGSAQFSTDSDIIKFELAFGNVVVHPSTMIRLDILRSVGGYDESYRFAQDYALWTKLSMSGVFIANIPRELIKYRTCEDQITFAKRDQQLECAVNITKKYVDHILGDDIQYEKIASLRQLLGADSFTYKLETIASIDLLIKLWNIFSSSENSDIKKFKESFAKRLKKKAESFSYEIPDIAFRFISWSIRIRPLLLFDVSMMKLIFKCCFYLIIWRKSHEKNNEKDC